MNILDFKKMNILFEWIFWIFKKMNICFELIFWIQGEDKIYGDLLNRIRTASHTEADVELLRTRVCHLKKVGGKERAEKELNSGEEKSSSDEEETIFDEEETIFDEEETIFDENANLEESGKKKNPNEDFVEKEYNCEENASSNLDKSTEKRKTTQEPDEEESSTEESAEEESNVAETSRSKLDRSGEKEKSTSRKGKSRRIAEKVSTLDKNALHVYGTNYKVNARNKAKLEEMPGKEFTMEAKSWSRTVKTFKTNKAGCVSNTPFLKTLKLKIGCEVVLVHNLDTLDGLTNGCRGKLVDVELSGGKVHRLVVEFDNPDHGRLARMRNPCKKHPKGTYIDRINWTYMLGGATAQVCQFPLKGAAAMTGHKIQVSITSDNLIISSN